MGRYQLLVAYLIPLVVAVAVSVIGLHQARQIAVADQDVVDTFYSFSQGWEGYKELRQEWRGRIMANALAGGLVSAAEGRHAFADQDQTMVYVAGFWAMGWLLMTFAVFIGLTRERALLYIFGIFAAVAFAYTPGIGWALITPYELPALFFFSLFVGLVMLGRPEWLVILVPVATLSKETALIMPLAFLFWDRLSMSRRTALAALTFVAAVALKGVVDVLTENPSPILTMTGEFTPDVPRWLDNLQRLLQADALNHPILVNAGLVIGLLLLPTADRRILLLKSLGVLFVVGNFLFGLIHEYRIWFEIVPLALYALDLHFFGSPLASSRLTRRLARSPRPAAVDSG